MTESIYGTLFALVMDAPLVGDWKRPPGYRRERAHRKGRIVGRPTGQRYALAMKNFKPLVVAGLVAMTGLTTLSPTVASAATSSRSCHWDRQTGRMICRRVPSAGTDAPPPAPTKQQQTPK